MAGTAFNDHAAVADVADEAAGDAVTRAVMNLDGAGARRFESKPAKCDVGNAGEFQQGLGEEGKRVSSFRTGRARLSSARRSSGGDRRTE